MHTCPDSLDGFLPYELSYIPEEFRKIAESELHENEETRAHGLQQLRSMLKGEKDLVWQDDDAFLLSFLRARKFDLKRTFHLIKTFYVVKRKRSELYQNFNFEDVRRTIEGLNVGFLPYRDSDGCVILVVKVDGWQPEEVSMGDLMRALTMGLLHANLNPLTTVAGVKVIFDFKGFKMYNLPHVSPTYLWLFAEALQNCFPGRFKAVHMVNEGHVFSYIWVVLKQFLTKKLRDRFHFHGKNVKSLHKFFSPRILPADYAGEFPPYDNSEWVQKMKEKSDYLYHVVSHGYGKCKVIVPESN